MLALRKRGPASCQYPMAVAPKRAGSVDSPWRAMQTLPMGKRPPSPEGGVAALGGASSSSSGGPHVGMALIGTDEGPRSETPARQVKMEVKEEPEVVAEPADFAIALAPSIQPFLAFSLLN